MLQIVKLVQMYYKYIYLGVVLLYYCLVTIVTVSKLSGYANK